MDDYGKSSTGFEENIVAAASYFGILGIIILFIEKRSHFVKFHAVQSMLGFSMLLVFWLAVKWISALYFLVWAPGLIALFVSGFMMIKSYDGEEYKLPIIGNLAFSAIYETAEDLLATAEIEPASNNDSKG